MAIARGTAVTGNTGGSASSFTLTGVVVSGSNRYLSLTVGFAGTGASAAVSTAVANGSENLTFVDARNAGSGSTACRVERWALVAPSVGTYNVVVTLAGSTFAGGIAQPFTGVDQSTPRDATVKDNGSSAAPTLSPAFAWGGGDDEQMIDVVWRNSSITFTPDLGVTPRSTGQSGSGSSHCGIARLSDTDTETGKVIGALSGSTGWAVMGLNLNAAATGAAPVADFSADATTGTQATTFTFTDASTNTPTSWAWDFGDGNTSTSQNPTHSYAADGTYTVALTATNASGSDSETKVDYITVLTAPVVDFSADTTSGAATLAVTFTDASTNTPTSWAWDFDDPGGTETSTSQNPTYNYTTPGTYSVKLTATNAAGAGSLTKTDYIVVVAPGGSVDIGRRIQRALRAAARRAITAARLDALRVAQSVQRVGAFHPGGAFGLSSGVGIVGGVSAASTRHVASRLRRARRKR